MNYNSSLFTGLPFISPRPNLVRRHSTVLTLRLLSWAVHCIGSSSGSPQLCPSPQTKGLPAKVMFSPKPVDPYPKPKYTNNSRLWSRHPGPCIPDAPSLSPFWSCRGPLSGSILLEVELRPVYTPPGLRGLPGSELWTEPSGAETGVRRHEEQAAGRGSRWWEGQA